jgi:hypothetical protein
MDILNEVFTGRTRQTRHLELASSPRRESTGKLTQSIAK